MQPDQLPLLATIGALALGLACLIWSVRVSDGARGAARRFKERAAESENILAVHRSVLGAHPGAILMWEGDAPDGGAPELFGSPVAMASLLRFTDDAVSADPAVRILEGLADLEARDGRGHDTTLRIRLAELREDGQPFSLLITAPSGRFLEADGRTAGARAVVWITDTTIKNHEESLTRGRLEEARQAIARDPEAFFEMWRKAPFPAWRLTGAGRLQWANDAYVSAVGASALDKVLERQLMLDSKITEQMKRAVDEGESAAETRRINIAGERRAMRVHTFPLKGGAGAVAFDITEAELARESLDHHVRAHDETLNHVTDGVAIFDGDRRLTFHNRAFAQLWKLEESYLLTRPTHAELLDRLRERRKLPQQRNYAKWRAAQLAQEPAALGEDAETWPLPDGRTLSVFRHRHPMGGLLLLFRDITDQLSLTTRYNEMIQTQAATLNRLHEACAVFGTDARLKLHNEAFVKLWRLESMELEKGMDYDDIAEACLPLYGNRDAWAAIKGHITGPGPLARRSTQAEINRSDGSIIGYLTHPLPDGNTLVAFADITSHRTITKALSDRADAMEAADRLKTAFVHNVSYQLRNPLTTILGYAQFLATGRHGELSEPQRKQLDHILAASGALDKLINDILDLAQIEAGNMALSMADTDVAAVAARAIELARSSAADTKVLIQADLPDDLGTIEADPARLHQVMFNLLTNALKFTEGGGTVQVSGERNGGMVRLCVRDEGRGIEPDKRVSSFDPFTTDDKRGAGLGLALVRHIVLLHKGNVVMRPAEGGGTEVELWLPVEAPDAGDGPVLPGRTPLALLEGAA